MVHTIIPLFPLRTVLSLFTCSPVMLSTANPPTLRTPTPPALRRPAQLGFHASSAAAAQNTTAKMASPLLQLDSNILMHVYSFLPTEELITACEVRLAPSDLLGRPPADNQRTAQLTISSPCAEAQSGLHGAAHRVCG